MSAAGFRRVAGCSRSCRARPRLLSYSVCSSDSASRPALLQTMARTRHSAYPCRSSLQSRADIYLRCECQVDRTAVRDRQQSCALVFTKWPVELNVPFDQRELRILRLAGATVLSVNSRMTKVHRDTLQRPLLPPRIHCNGHGSARAQCGQEQIVRCRASIGAAGRRGLVAAEMMRTGRNLLRETIGSAAHDDDPLGRWLVGHGMWAWLASAGRSPSMAE